MATRITIDVWDSHLPKSVLEELVETLETYGASVTKLKTVYKSDKTVEVLKEGRWTNG